MEKRHVCKDRTGNEMAVFMGEEHGRSFCSQKCSVFDYDGGQRNLQMRSHCTLMSACKVGKVQKR